MKIANIREFRNKVITFLKDNESVLITKHGKVTGLLYPIKENDTLPDTPFLQHIDTKTFLLEELKKALKIGRTGKNDIYRIQKEWEFRGNASTDLLAERDKR